MNAAAGRRPTITDVAREAGASRTSTSRALSGRGYTSPDLLERVHRAVEKLGYVPDVMARNLKQQTSTTLGLLISDLSNPFYAEVASGASRRARERGYTIMLADTNGDADEERAAARNLIGQRVAGLMATPVSERLSMMDAPARTPVVEIDRAFGRADSVTVDNAQGARTATRHLIDLGHRRIALVLDETDWSTGRLRRDGYLEAMGEAGLPVDDELLLTVGYEPNAAGEATHALLDCPRPPTAFFAANNLVARGVWSACANRGLRLPDQVSLVAFDEAAWMTMVTPPVTTVVQDAAALGARAVNLLLDRLTDPAAEPRRDVLPVELVVRGSTGAPPPPA